MKQSYIDLYNKEGSDPAKCSPLSGENKFKIDSFGV